MKYRQIKTDFWQDGYISELTDKEKLFFIYLFTNDRVNMCGIYELPDKFMLPTLGATLGELENMKQKMQKDNKYAFYKGWVFIINFADHNRYSSADNVVKAYLKEFNAIPAEILSYFTNTLCLEYCCPIESKVMVKVMVMDKYGRPYPRFEARLDERVNPKDIPL